MRTKLIIFILLLSAFAYADSTATGQREIKQYSIEQFLATTTIGGSSFTADDKTIAFSSNQSGIFNVYSLPVTGGKPKPLTNSTKESVFIISYFPTGDRFLFRHDQGGNENSHIYMLDDQGKEQDLTPGEKVKASFVKWSADNKAFFYSTNQRDPKFFDLYKMDIATMKSEKIYEDNTGYELGDVSDDERYLVFAKPNTTNDSDIYLYKIDTKEMKHITPHKGDASNDPASFDPKSKYLYYLTNDGSEFQYIVRYDLQSGKLETVQKADWDVMYTYFSRHGKYRVVGINQDARTKIEVYDESSGKQIELPTLPDGDITSVNISDSEKLLSFYFNGDRSPSNLHVYDFTTKKVTKLTESLNPEINPDDLVDAQVIRHSSFDKMQIPALLFKPHQSNAENKAPAIVWVHGGPGGQSRKGYNSLIQYLVNHGYVILAINNRGSSGYGKAFLKADDQKHGYEPLWDCVEAKKYLATLPYVDGSKIGIMGGSYGGYMVLAALTLKPEEFAVGVDLFGISNWVRTLESIPPYWESFRKALYDEVGDPVKDKEKLLATSPLFHADKIVKPLMILQGANDPRVLKQESDDIVNEIKKRNGVVEYIVFDDEGHGFIKKENQIKGYKATLDFLDRYLKGQSAKM